jgi:hypothetical protein
MTYRIVHVRENGKSVCSVTLMGDLAAIERVVKAIEANERLHAHVHESIASRHQRLGVLEVDDGN